MKGAELKEILRKEGVVLFQLAEDLGMSQQNLSAAFTRDDVKSGLIEKIAKSLGKSVGYFYGEVQSLAAPNTVATEFIASTDKLLELLEAKEDQLTLAMKQTSVAQEQVNKALAQMDRVIGALQAPRSAPVHIADIAADFTVLPPTTPKVNSCIVGTRSSTKRPARKTGKLTISRHKGPNSEID